MTEAYFVRQTADIFEALAHISRMERQGAMKDRCVIEAKVELAKDEFDAFMSDFFKDYDWLKGKGGISTQGVRCCVYITCQERGALLVDPSGYNYARYVGIMPIDAERMI